MQYRLGTTVPHLQIVRVLSLFVFTALAEIAGCYLPYLWLRKSGSPWLLLPGASSLAVFVWLLTLHPVPAGRVYAAYGGVYITVAMIWLRTMDGVSLTRWDATGIALTLLGVGVIVVGGWRV